MNDLYDILKDDPTTIEKLENTVPNNVARGGSFELHPLHILEIPERRILRANMEERYGISSIDDYFIPVIVDINTYRNIEGKEEPDILQEGFDEWYRKSRCAEAHVKKIGDWFISYISTNIETDPTIEHEGIHAFILKNNPHYVKSAPTIGSTFMIPPSNKIRSWMEAVPWVATTDNVDVNAIFNYYVNTIETKGTFSKIKELGKMVWDLLQISYYESKEKIKGHQFSDVPYTIALNGIRLINGIQAIMDDPEQSIAEWKYSFELAAGLKEKYGVKELVRLAGCMHQDELGDLL